MMPPIAKIMCLIDVMHKLMFILGLIPNNAWADEWMTATRDRHCRFRTKSATQNQYSEVPCTVFFSMCVLSCPTGALSCISMALMWNINENRLARYQNQRKVNHANCDGLWSHPGERWSSMPPVFTLLNIDTSMVRILDAVLDDLHGMTTPRYTTHRYTTPRYSMPKKRWGAELNAVLSLQKLVARRISFDDVSAHSFIIKNC